MKSWIDTLVDVLAAEGETVLVTVAATRGSAPREAATRMIVTPDALHGTIGGGHLETGVGRLLESGIPHSERRRGGDPFRLADVTPAKGARC